MGKWRYGVVLDAGSSGTRIYVYRWLKSAVAQAVADEEELRRLPELKTKKKWTMKVHPGISTFADEPKAVGPNHLRQLFDQASDVVPMSEVENTPIFLLATAGMRLLPDTQRSVLLQEICSYARSTTKFQLPDCDLHVQVIPGETEGLYGWIAANYLVGGFDQPKAHAHGKDHHTYGFLDMGGASAQIAFAPNATEAEKHANDLKLLRLRSVDGTQSEYQVFVTTWLGYGANEARRRYVELLTESVDLKQTMLLPDPCLPNGLQIKKDGTVINPGSEEDQGLEPYLVGTGRFSECLASTFPLLDKTAVCDDPPCLFHGVHVPAIDFSVNHFIGISEFWHTTHEIFEMGHTDKAYDFLTYQTRVTEFCSQDWTSVTKGVSDEQWGKKIDIERAVEACFKASWLINLLHEGIGIPRVGIEAGSQPDGTNGTKQVLEAVSHDDDYLAPFQAVNKIDDTEVSWTLGKMVLYAASQIPPADTSVQAVGFGSNIEGIPADFQYAGGIADTVIPGGIDMSNYGDWDDDDVDDAEELDWEDRVLSTSNLPRRAPGFLLFLFILLVALFLLCGRDRRTNLVRKVSNLFRRNHPNGSPNSLRKRRGLANTLPFGLGGDNGKGKYERVLEEGDADIPHPAEFELAPVASSSDDDAASLSSKGSVSSISSIGNGRRSRRSGTATTRKMIAAAPNLPSGGGYFDGAIASLNANALAQGVGLGLGPMPMLQTGFDRGLVQSESRERLDWMARGYEASGAGNGAATGHKSRSGSPTRWRSPLLTPLKENLD